MGAKHKKNVLVIPDLHEPFSHKHALEHCKEIQKKYKCNTVIQIGDLVDNHALSVHEHNPDGYSPLHEYSAALLRIALWKKAFPDMMICKGNHDERLNKRAIRCGIYSAALRSFDKLWEFPKGWKYGWNFIIDGVKYQHGDGYSGQRAHINAAKSNRMSTVIGHIHTVGGVDYLAGEHSNIFAMASGCLIDADAYAFDYARFHKDKSVLGCGVVVEGGTIAYFEPLRV